MKIIKKIEFLFHRFVGKAIIFVDKKFYSHQNKDVLKYYNSIDFVSVFNSLKIPVDDPDFIKLLKNIDKNNNSNIPYIFDADISNQKLLFYLIRFFKPKIVVETGVANGRSSRIILESLKLNKEETFKLYSIDLPPFKSTSIGKYVSEELKRNWHLILGSSFIELPRLLKRIGKMDFFIHDSVNTYHFQRFELKLAYKYLNNKGIMIVNNVSHNIAFNEFVQKNNPSQAFVVKQIEKKMI